MMGPYKEYVDPHRTKKGDLKVRTYKALDTYVRTHKLRFNATSFYPIFRFLDQNCEVVETHVDEIVAEYEATRHHKDNRA